jgi:hypothetical protein
MLLLFLICMTYAGVGVSANVNAADDWLVTTGALYGQELNMVCRGLPDWRAVIGLGANHAEGITFQQTVGDWESRLYETISSDWQCKPVTYFMRGVEVISYPALDILSPIGLYLYDRQDAARTGLLGFVGDCATVISLKLLVNRARPEEETSRIDSSFPSGHTAFVFTQAVVYSHHEKSLRIPLYLYATVVGFSRVYLKKHYPTDVLGGAALGILVGILAVKISD